MATLFNEVISLVRGYVIVQVKDYSHLTHREREIIPEGLFKSIKDSVDLTEFQVEKLIRYLKEYSFAEIEDYVELTDKERAVLSEESFMKLKGIIVQTDIPTEDGRVSLTYILEVAKEISERDELSLDQIYLKQITADDGDIQCIEITVKEAL